MKRLVLALLFLLATVTMTSAQQISHTAFRIQKFTSAPATCATGDVYFDTGVGSMFQCTAANTWTQVPLAGGGGNPPFTDASALVKNAADATKLAIFSAANITTGTTRTYTLIDGNGTLPIGPTAGPITFAGPTTARTVTFPDASFTAARTDASNTFTGAQTITSIIGLTGAVTPNAAGGTDIGSASLPFANVWIGAAATNNFKITGTATAARVFTLPDTASDTFTLNAATATLTNKTYDTGGTGNVFKIAGTTITAISGNTATVGTKSGAWTSGNCLKSDVSGNIVDAGACGGGITVGTTTITSGTTTRMLYDNAGVVGETAGFTFNNSGQLVTMNASDAVTNTRTSVLTLQHNTSGTATTDFGVQVPFNLDSNTTANRPATVIGAGWEVATDASRKSYGVLQALNASQAMTDVVRWTISSTGAGQLTFQGDGTVGRPNITFGGPVADASNHFGIVGDSGGGSIGFARSGTGWIRVFASEIRTNSGIPFNWSSGDPYVAGSDTGLRRVVAKVVGISDSGSNTNGWLQWSGEARLTADVTNATTTFSNLSDLTISNLQAGRKYIGQMSIKCINSQAAEGIKFDFNGGTATMTNFWAAAGILASGGSDVVGTNISTSLSGAINFTTFTGESNVVFNVSFVVNAGGTLIPRFAENTSVSGTATARLGSFILLNDSPN